MLLWRILDALEIRKTKSSCSFSIDQNIDKSFDDICNQHFPNKISKLKVNYYIFD